MTLPKLGNTCRSHCRCGETFEAATPDLLGEAYQRHLMPLR